MAAMTLPSDPPQAVRTEAPASGKTPAKDSTPVRSKTSTPTITPTPQPTLGIGSIMIREEDGMEMVYVPAGEFEMGS